MAFLGEAQGTKVLKATGFDGAYSDFGTVTVMSAVSEETSEFFSCTTVTPPRT